jgi:hypothetical protein
MFEPRPIDALLYVSLFLLSCGLVGMCSGCKPMPPEGPLPARTELRAPVAAALESGATLSEIGGLVADDLGGCVAARSVAAAMRTASGSVRSQAATLPRIAWDVSPCGSLGDGVDIDQRVTLAVRAAAGLVTAVLTSAPDLEARDCRGYRWGLASVRYVEGVAVGVLDELAAPDGQVIVDAVAVDLGGCP